MIQTIIKAVKAYFGTIGIISKLKLWKYFAIPILISVITATIVFGAAYVFSDNLGHYLADLWKWDWGKETFSTISNILGGVSIAILGLILYKHIILALSAPFMSPVSEKIENYFLGKDYPHIETSFTEQLVRGIKLSLRNMSFELLLTIPLIFLSFIPVIGFFFAAFSFIIQAYYAGFGNIDYTLERHYKYKDSISFVKENKGIAIGNGLVFMLFLLIPFVGIILVLPLSVTAATTETIKQIEIKKLRE